MKWLSVLHMDVAFRKLDITVACGAAIIFLAAGLFAGRSAPLASELEQSRQTLLTLDREVLFAVSGKADLDWEANHPMTAFEAVLTPRSALPAVVERLFVIATEHGLELGKGDYRLDHEPSGDFFYYRITLPILGPYPQLRAFVETVLVDWPGSALESISFSRGHAEEALTEAVIHLALLVRDRT